MEKAVFKVEILADFNFYVCFLAALSTLDVYYTPHALRSRLLPQTKQPAFPRFHSRRSIIMAKYPDFCFAKCGCQDRKGYFQRRRNDNQIKVK